MYPCIKCSNIRSISSRLLEFRPSLLYFPIHLYISCMRLRSNSPRLVMVLVCQIYYNFVSELSKTRSTEWMSTKWSHIGVNTSVLQPCILLSLLLAFILDSVIPQATYISCSNIWSKNHWLELSRLCLWYFRYVEGILLRGPLDKLS